MRCAMLCGVWDRRELGVLAFASKESADQFKWGNERKPSVRTLSSIFSCFSASPITAVVNFGTWGIVTCL